MDKTEFVELVRQNKILKDRVDELNALIYGVKTSLLEGIESLGYTDDKGHIIVDVDDETSGVNRVVYQRRVSKVLDMDVAEELLKEKGIYDQCITMVPMLNEEEIMASFYNDSLTEEDIDKMFPSKVTWALVVK